MSCLFGVVFFADIPFGSFVGRRFPAFGGVGASSFTGLSLDFFDAGGGVSPAESVYEYSLLHAGRGELSLLELEDGLASQWRGLGDDVVLRVRRGGEVPSMPGWLPLDAAVCECVPRDSFVAACVTCASSVSICCSSVAVCWEVWCR